MIQWYSGNYCYATCKKTFVFPIAYTVDYWIIGTGFWIDSITAQEIDNKVLTGFSTSNVSKDSGTAGWITIGS